MKVNEIYNDIYGFWSAVYPVIGFHVALILVLRWINYPVPSVSVFFSKNDNSRKTKIKEFIETFHLQNVMPVFLIFMVIGYFALFNVAEGTYSSIRSILPVFKINSYAIMDELNNIPDHAAADSSAPNLAMVQAFPSSLQHGDLSDRFLTKFYRWNYLMELTEFLVIFVLVLLFILRRRNKKLSRVIRIKPLLLFFMLSLFIMTFMRLKQEVFLFKAVRYKTMQSDVEYRGRLQNLVDKECLLMNFLEKKLNLKVAHLEEGEFNR